MATEILEYQGRMEPPKHDGAPSVVELHWRTVLLSPEFVEAAAPDSNDPDHTVVWLRSGRTVVIQEKLYSFQLAWAQAL